MDNLEIETEIQDIINRHNKSIDYKNSEEEITRFLNDLKENDENYVVELLDKFKNIMNDYLDPNLKQIYEIGFEENHETKSSILIIKNKAPYFIVKDLEYSDVSGILDSSRHLNIYKLLPHELLEIKEIFKDEKIGELFIRQQFNIDCEYVSLYNKKEEFLKLVELFNNLKITLKLLDGEDYIINCLDEFPKSLGEFDFIIKSKTNANKLSYSASSEIDSYNDIYDFYCTICMNDDDKEQISFQKKLIVQMTE